MSKRCFRIWQEQGPCPGQTLWRWECSLCHPPARGGRYGGLEAFRRVITMSMPRHFRVRWYHHEHVRKTSHA